MGYICIKCNTQMEKAIIAYTGLTVKKESGKLFENKESRVGCYVCPTCGFIEYYAEKPDIFK